MSAFQESWYFCLNVKVSTAFSTILIPVPLSEKMIFVNPVLKQLLSMSICGHLILYFCLKFILFIRTYKKFDLSSHLQKKYFQNNGLKKYMKKAKSKEKDEQFNARRQELIFVFYLISKNFDLGFQCEQMYCLINIYLFQAQMICCCGEDNDSDNEDFQKKNHEPSFKRTKIKQQIVPTKQIPPTPQKTMPLPMPKQVVKPLKITFQPSIQPISSLHHDYYFSNQTSKPHNPALVIEPYSFIRESNLIEKPLQESFVDDIQEEVIERDEQLNSDFANTVRDSMVMDQTPEPFIDYQLLLENGLPNIGNTCYLNSVLQMLYSADKFRGIIVKLSEKPQLVFHQLVANVFQDIEKRSSMDKKRKDLQKLVQYIQKRQVQFVKFSQNDALESLLCILNMLEQQYPACSKLNYFKVKYQMRCGCKKMDAIIENYCVKSNQFCLMCKKPVKYLIQNTGPYIIILPNAQTYRFKQFIKFINKDKNHIYYQHKSLITHFGTRHSGHYISHRRVDNKWIRISDSLVKIAGNLEKQSDVPMITLYQFKKRRVD